MNKVNTIREQTRRDLEDKLSKYGKCALIRCTGFGKTWMLADMIKDCNKVLYFYPFEIVENTVKYAITAREGRLQRLEKESLYAKYGENYFRNVNFISYRQLIEYDSNKLKELLDGCELIIFDECHRMGGEKTKQALYKFLKIVKKMGIRYIGATATPDRMDGFDVITEFFDNRTVYPYTLHDAFQDEIIKRPYYCYMSYNVKSDIKNELDRQGIKGKEVTKELKGKMIELSNLFSVENSIKNTMTECGVDDSYQKHIVFFSTEKHIEEKGKDVEKWFRKAYPKHKINRVIITSQSEDESNNIGVLDKLTYRENTIDLIYCINMLNMGYHVNDLTSIIMYRGTKSNIVYSQQLGRALSAGSDKPCIVFDIVDNLHTSALYGTYGKKASDGEDNKGNKDDTGTGGWWKDGECNKIYSEDLIATSHQAKYREMLSKIVAEPVVERCRVAYKEFYRIWEKYIIPTGKKYPQSRSEVQINDSFGLKHFADWKKVTVEQVLDAMEEDKVFEKFNGVYY